MPRRFRQKTLNPKEIEALHSVAFLMDNEADKMEQENPDLLATDSSSMTFDVERMRLYQMLRSLAEWIRSVLTSLL